MRLRFDRRDAAVAALCFTATALYFVLLPHSLGPADESVHLYEAQRVLEGEVLYRDVFNFIPPGWFYLMASLFGVFGTSIETARGAMAVMHGLTAALVYLTSRRLGIGAGLAWLPALGYLAICQSAWLIVSQHWVSTLLCAAVLYVCAGRADGRPRWALAAGILLGLLIVVQQQRGVFMAAGVTVWLGADALVRRRYTAAPLLAPLAAELVRLAAGVAAIVVPVLGLAVARAGFGAVWYALVVFPLVNYRSEMHCDWGDVNFMTAAAARYTFPLVLKYLPVALLVSGARLVWLLARGADPRTARRLLLLLVFCGASALSIAYFPDFIKIAFVAFAFLVAATEVLAWAVRFVPQPVAIARPLGAIAAAALLLGGAFHLYRNAVRLHGEYPHAHRTAFGRVDYANADEPRLHEELVALLADAPSRDLYAYPLMSDLYLTVPAHNPTPYGFFFASGYHRPEEVQRVIDVLAAAQLPYIVLLPGLLPADDPVRRWVEAHYTPISQPFAGRVIYRRVGST